MRTAMVLGSVLAVTTPIFADTGVDTLRFYLSKSDLVVLGEITSEPMGFVTELGFMNYVCDFRIEETLKGPKPSTETIDVSIVIFGAPEDRPPGLKKGGRCILFLKEINRGSVHFWQTADVWFGFQRPNSSMASSLKRLAEQEKAKRNE